MKKRILFLLLVCVLMMQPLAARASESAAPSEDAMLIELIKEQYSEMVQEFLQPEQFADSLIDVDLTRPIMPVFVGMVQSCVQMSSLEEMAQACVNPYNNHSMVIFEETPFKVHRYRSGTMIDFDQYESIPIYIQDIRNGTVRQVFQDMEHEIQAVYCFTRRNEGTSVVYVTDGGTFVHWYTSDESQAIEYGWDEFKEYSLAWQEYMRSYLEESGYYGGCSGDFAGFVDEYKAQKEAARQEALEAARQRAIWIAVSVGAVVVLAAGAAVLVYSKKRKNLQADA